jgi:hypothetical protein
MKGNDIVELFQLDESVAIPAAKPAMPVANRDGNRSTNGQLNPLATARAKVVLPVPGGPNNTIAWGDVTPCSAAYCGRESGSTIRRSMRC